MKYLLVIFTLIFASSCSNSELEAELAQSKKELADAVKKLELAQHELTSEGKLIHIVLFDLKTEADQDALVKKLKKLREIEQVQRLSFGPFENLGDGRALSDYEFIMEMDFANQSAYESYQKHPIHLALKENTVSFMAGPPATYDYIQR